MSNVSETRALKALRDGKMRGGGISLYRTYLAGIRIGERETFATPIKREVRAEFVFISSALFIQIRNYSRKASPPVCTRSRISLCKARALRGPFSERH